jgi:RIO kinase 1
MELVGLVEERARRLAEVDVENPETAYEVVREYMRRLHAAGLVHGDLSEYNMIIHDGELVVIDLGQAVTVHHPNADEFLRRDCRNVAGFFGRQGLNTDGSELYEFVTEVEAKPGGTPDGPDVPDT